MTPKHCYYFSEESGRCMHKSNTGSTFSWCCAGWEGWLHRQHTREQIEQAGCELYKAWKAEK